MSRAQQHVAVAAALGSIGGVLLGFAIGRSWASDREPAAPLKAIPVQAPPPMPMAPAPAPVAPVPAVVAPQGSAAPARDIGTPPYKLHSFTIHRWEGVAWRIRANLRVTRLRDVPDGTQLGSKVTCRVNGSVFASSGIIGPPGGPLAVGETGTTISDHFFHDPFVGIPEQCELILYVQMPGARHDRIDHEVGRICIMPGAQKDEIGDKPCPVILEAPSP